MSQIEVLKAKDPFASLVGKSQSLRNIINLGKKIAESDLPILITGQSGVGKEALARSIHAASPRKNNEFIAINSGAIPENLMESILFGHEKGAFTGAVSRNLGKFREAQNGIIFLDEVGDLKSDLQVKLLRVLQDGEIDPVGSAKPIKVDVRLIYATNLDLKEQVATKKFREDLYYRLNIFPIDIPPLKDRAEDILPLLEYFLADFKLKTGKNIKSINEEALKYLQSYYWPGNIRQLKNMLFRAIILAENDELTIQDFPEICEYFNKPSVMESDIIAKDKNLSQLSGALGFVNHLLCLDKNGDLRSLEDIEKDFINKALQICSGSMTEVARRLKISRSTLYRKIEDYGIRYV